jgi:NhaP-type Na+/H+ or K+/H+ antiporter
MKRAIRRRWYAVAMLATVVAITTATGVGLNGSAGATAGSGAPLHTCPPGC